MAEGIGKGRLDGPWVGLWVHEEIQKLDRAAQHVVSMLNTTDPYL